MWYICEFIFKGEVYVVYSENGIRFFTDGFWVNENLMLTTGVGAKYWIPPHKINYIEIYEERK